MDAGASLACSRKGREGLVWFAEGLLRNPDECDRDRRILGTRAAALLMAPHKAGANGDPHLPLQGRWGCVMSRTDVFRYVGFGVVILLGIVTATFFFGYAFADLEGSLAVALVVAWALPVVALSWLAVTRPRYALPTLVTAACGLAAVSLVNGAAPFLPPTWGPVAEVAAVGLAIATAFLGLRRAAPAGWLLLGILGWVLIPRVVVAVLVGEFRGFGGPGTAIAAPLLLGAVLFLAASRARRAPAHSGLSSR